LTCKIRRPYNLYCVGGDVKLKQCTITITIKFTAGSGHNMAFLPDNFQAQA